MNPYEEWFLELSAVRPHIIGDEVIPLEHGGVTNRHTLNMQEIHRDIDVKCSGHHANVLQAFTDLRWELNLPYYLPYR